MSGQSIIKIIDINTNETLYQYKLTEQNAAYDMATKLEEIGLDIKLTSPTITESLCDSLGMSIDEKEEYNQSVTAELEDHEGSCCHKQD